MRNEEKKTNEKIFLCILLLLCIVTLAYFRTERVFGPIQGIVTTVTDHGLILKPRVEQDDFYSANEFFVYTDLLKDEKSQTLIKVLKEGDCIALWYKGPTWTGKKVNWIFRPQTIVRVKFAVY